MQEVSAIAHRLKELHNDAVIAYTPQVQELCDKKATQNEVERMLDWLLMYAGGRTNVKVVQASMQNLLENISRKHCILYYGV